jgi:hypothetical protein
MIKLVEILTPFLIASSSVYADPRITLSIDDVQSPFLNSKGVQVSLTGPRASVLEVKLGEMLVQGSCDFPAPGFRLRVVRFGAKRAC